MVFVLVVYNKFMKIEKIQPIQPELPKRNKEEKDNKKESNPKPQQDSVEISDEARRLAEEGFDIPL